MSTPPVSTKPDVRMPHAEPERRAIEAPARPPVESQPTDRAVPADLLLDVPQLTVEELTLELDASLLLDRVKLDAKGLDASLYLKADFERLQALARKDNGAMERPAQDSQRRRVAPGLLAAAGLAGGAVLESQLKPSEKLPIPRRRNRAQAMLDSVRKRLP